MTKIQRTRNVERAFAVSKKKKAILQGRSVILVDDVFTTGATLNACSKALLKAGAKEVHAITLGRVTKTRSI
jgi:predicted amidophosphoribosyltransferase